MKRTTKTELKQDALNIASALCDRYPLYHCNASVLTHRRCERFVLLQSYYTITGIADLKTHNIYIFDYSATSIQHAYKFQKYLQEEYKEYFNVVKLWSHSQLTASEKRKLGQEDYSSLIQLS